MQAMQASAGQRFRMVHGHDAHSSVRSAENYGVESCGLVLADSTLAARRSEVMGIFEEGGNQ